MQPTAIEAINFEHTLQYLPTYDDVGKQVFSVHFNAFEFRKYIHLSSPSCMLHKR